MKFICKSCNYRFESELDQRENKCPYCGEIGVINEPDAEDLVKGAE